jgi:Fe-S-cluster containining protein
MSRRERLEAAYAELDELYESIPRVRCKGLCADSCTIAPASELEKRRMAEHGHELITQRPPGPIPRCPSLGPLNNCLSYHVRPFVCRAFGVVVDDRVDSSQWHRQPLMCDHGCVSDDGRYVPLAEMYRVSEEIERLSRGVTGVAGTPLPEDF